MINTLIEEEQKYGIYTSKYDWNETTNSTNRFSRVPLWYIYNDGKNNFNDFYEKSTKNTNYPIRYNNNDEEDEYHTRMVTMKVDEYVNNFGDWEIPTIKQYYDEYSERRKICGKGFDYLYW
uniref:ATS domain-containing protein n=1 Tax=Meloidogyne hapla TaxID=6305 RepID=A0A1I8B8E7_MELHA